MGLEVCKDLKVSINPPAKSPTWWAKCSAESVHGERKSQKQSQGRGFPQPPQAIAPHGLQRQGQMRSLPGLEECPLWMGDSVPGCTQLVDFSSSLEKTRKNMSDTKEASLRRTPITTFTSVLTVRSQTPDMGAPRLPSFTRIHRAFTEQTLGIQRCIILDP